MTIRTARDKNYPSIDKDSKLKKSRGALLFHHENEIVPKSLHFNYRIYSTVTLLNRCWQNKRCSPDRIYFWNTVKITLIVNHCW